MKKRTLKQILATSIVGAGLLFNSGCAEVGAAFIIDKGIIEPVTGFSLTDAVIKGTGNGLKNASASLSNKRIPSTEQSPHSDSRAATAQYNQTAKPVVSYSSQQQYRQEIIPKPEMNVYQREQEEKQKSYAFVKSLEYQLQQAEISFRNIEREKRKLLEQKSSNIKISNKQEFDKKNEELNTDILIPILNARRVYEEAKSRYENAKSAYEGKYGR